MDSFHLQNLPADESFDVIVAGGGPAGCAAAIAAAREGARTLLIEASYALGGMGTSGLVPAWCPFSDKEQLIYRGIAETVFTAAKAAVPHVRSSDLDWVAIDAEALKRIYDELVVQSGAHVLFGTQLCGAETDQDGGVTAVLAANKSGLTVYRAETYIDCTGDADLAAFAGAEFAKGDEGGEVMPSTHCFILANVDLYALQYDRRSGRDYGGLHPNNPNSIVYEIAKDDRYPLISDPHLCYNIVGPGAVGFNAGHLWKVDNTDPESVAKAMMEGRQLAFQFRQALAEYFPEAFAGAYLVSTAPLMGIRESRRIIGDYVLTVDDYLARRSFADEICRNSYYLDVHCTAEEAERAAAAGIDLHVRYGKGESHGIPYRCLLPRTLSNVLVAGRSVSCDRRIQGSVRVMPTCLAMGEAAGMAAAMAAGSASGNVHKIDAEKLRTGLREAGAYLPL